MKNFLIYWLPTFIWCGVIYTFSAQPSIQTTHIYWQDFILKKSAHVIEYFILVQLFNFSFSHTTNLPKNRRLWLALLAAIIYAASDEFHQSFVSGRGATVRDVFIDSFGALISFFITRKTSRIV